MLAPSGEYFYNKYIPNALYNRAAAVWQMYSQRADFAKFVGPCCWISVRCLPIVCIPYFFLLLSFYCHYSLLCWHCVRDWQLGKYTWQRASWRQQLAADTRLRQVNRQYVHHFTGCHQNCRRRLRLVLLSTFRLFFFFFLRFSFFIITSVRLGGVNAIRLVCLSLCLYAADFIETWCSDCGYQSEELVINF